MQAVGLKTFIWNNNLRSLVLLAGFPVLLVGMVVAGQLALLGMGVSVQDPQGRQLLQAGSWAQMLASAVPVALTVGGVWFAVAYVFNQTIIDLATGARTVQRKDEPELYNLLENLCISRGMKTPTIRVIETDAMNAFASGLHEGRFSVTVTRGLLQGLDPGELEAVLAHELTHIINRDVRTMVIAAIFAGIITLIAEVIFRTLYWSGGGRGRRGAGVFILIAMAAAAIGYLLAIVIRMTLSRSREFVADMGSVELTKNPDAMISALRKISGHSKLEAPDSVSAMFLDDDDGPMGLFATHPPISKRIDALVRYAGGRVTQIAPTPAAVEAPVPGARPWGRPKGPWG